MTSIVEPSDLRGFDARKTLDTVLAEHTAAARSEAKKLAVIVHFADLHPVVTGRDIPAAWPTDSTLHGEQIEVPISGDGTPQVTEAAVYELSAALGISYQGGLSLVGQTLELRYRLPKLWDLVQDLTLPAWQGRRAAEQTMTLSRRAVAWVDGQLAILGRRGRLTHSAILGVVGTARVRFDPDARDVEQQVLDSRGVWWRQHEDTPVVTDLFARLDTLHAQALEATIADLAVTLGRLGDRDNLEVRRATALGLLADPQLVLDLAAGHEAASLLPRRPTGSATLYLHVDADDLEAGTGGSGGSVERLGGATLQLLHDWLDRIGNVSVRPVLDLARTDAVDAHDPPDWMHHLVVLRDRHCVFPGCRTDARSCDLDHITPYDEHGPPGQTHPGNLAPLCRRHHNRKTHHGWTYTREPGGYRWTSPRGRVHLVPHLQ